MLILLVNLLTRNGVLVYNIKCKSMHMLLRRENCFLKNLSGTRTEANLLAAFAGESQARNKYSFYASKARADGYNQIAAIFEETAENEKAHAKLWFKTLKNGMPDTLENLKDAAGGEHFEWSKMYQDFADDARNEGFDRIAVQFEIVAEVEKRHEERYNKLIQNIKENKVFEKDTPQSWICSKCGHIHFGTAAPEVCPVCAHPKAFFHIEAKNY